MKYVSTLGMFIDYLLSKFQNSCFTRSSTSIVYINTDLEKIARYEKPTCVIIIQKFGNIWSILPDQFISASIHFWFLKSALYYNYFFLDLQCSNGRQEISYFDLGSNFSSWNKCKSLLLVVICLFFFKQK